MTKIKIEIEDEPYLVQQRKDSDLFFATKTSYSIVDECMVHMGSTGSQSIEQIEEEFKRIIEHLKNKYYGGLSKEIRKEMESKTHATR